MRSGLAFSVFRVVVVDVLGLACAVLLMDNEVARSDFATPLPISTACFFVSAVATVVSPFLTAQSSSWVGTTRYRGCLAIDFPNVQREGI
jgi:hypothetical protein